jgi:hypothetical protein
MCAWLLPLSAGAPAGSSADSGSTPPLRCDFLGLGPARGAATLRQTLLHSAAGRYKTVSRPEM